MILRCELIAMLGNEVCCAVGSVLIECITVTRDGLIVVVIAGDYCWCELVSDGRRDVSACLTLLLIA